MKYLATTKAQELPILILQKTEQTVLRTQVLGGPARLGCPPGATPNVVSRPNSTSVPFSLNRAVSNEADCYISFCAPGQLQIARKV